MALARLSSLLAVALLVFLTVGCSSGPAAAEPADSRKTVLAAETFLADIARNVAGDRVEVTALIPAGVDPHGFEPTPGDVARVARSDVLIVNGAGFEEFLDELLENAGGERLVIEASAGLTSQPTGGAGGDEHEADPHFWLDPRLAVKYVENIRDGLSEADPEGAATYSANAAAYIAELEKLDGWIAEEVKQVPVERRLLVTNHESFGYYADRYGFRIVGTILQSVGTSASPSAQQMAQLTEEIRRSGAPAVFLETGTNPQLAEQLARETGVNVVTGLYTHSTTDATGPAPTYVEMLRHDTRVIVDALR